MKTKDFDYFLDKELIAQSPVYPRDSSNLLILNKNTWYIEHKKFYDIVDYLWENDVLVLNKTRVINARLHGNIIEGSKYDKEIEIFLHKQIDEFKWDCLVFPWKKLAVWSIVKINSKNKDYKEEDLLIASIKEISQKWRIVEFNKSWDTFFKKIENIWEIPLPPYIKQKLEDKDRYQSIWSEISWSVAAPTASLHFTDELIKKIIKKWVQIEKVLLHVWLWTFEWVKTEYIKDHKMHSEYIEIDKDTADRLNKYKKLWKNIIALGTTSIRVLESFSDENANLSFGSKQSNIFIYPWYKWKFVDSAISNFHLPKSSLIMLISSLWWTENVKKAYEEAIKNKYRFFSFGDAMFIK